jgi:hypothetical protein
VSDSALSFQEGLTVGSGGIPELDLVPQPEHHLPLAPGLTCPRLITCAATFGIPVEGCLAGVTVGCKDLQDVASELQLDS